jgi:hypothetical protein
VREPSARDSGRPEHQMLCSLLRCGWAFCDTALNQVTRIAFELDLMVRRWLQRSRAPSMGVKALSQLVANGHSSAALARVTVRFLLRSADAPGGVARSVLNLAGHLALTHDVEVISLFRRRRRPVYGRPAGVRMLYLDDRREGRDAARRARRGVARMLARLPTVLIHRTDPMYASC